MSISIHQSLETLVSHAVTLSHVSPSLCLSAATARNRAHGCAGVDPPRPSDPSHGCAGVEMQTRAACPGRPPHGCAGVETQTRAACPGRPPHGCASVWSLLASTVSPAHPASLASCLVQQCQRLQYSTPWYILQLMSH
jgi:hypothetical protein